MSDCAHNWITLRGYAGTELLVTCTECGDKANHKEITRLQADNEALRARVADLVAWADNYVGARLMYDEIEAARSLQLDIRPRDLRKQAEAVDKALDECAWWHDRECLKISEVMGYADRLRNAAEQIERGEDHG